MSHLSTVAALSFAATLACDDYTCQDTATCVFEDEGDGGASSLAGTAESAASVSSTNGSTSERAATEAFTSEPMYGATANDGSETERWDNATSGSDDATSTSNNDASSAPRSDTSTLGTDWSSSDASEGTKTSDEANADTSANGVVETSSAPPEECGDGVRQSDEECDDGNSAEGDGCGDCAVSAGWRCSGDVGAKSSCVDIDECNEGTANCDVNATCSDRDGGFECFCNEGYSGSGQSCQNVNECEDSELNDCHVDAICTDAVGSFACECKPGFEGSGTACVEEPHVTKLAIGNQMCALISDGRVFCWGGWALGNGPNDNNYQPIPTEVSGLTTAIDVTVGGNTVCALLSNKTVRCWGSDELGQASGSGTSSTGISTPTTISGLTNVAAVSNTNWTSCALLANGTVRCFGGSDGSGGTPTATRTMSPLSTTSQLSSPADTELCAVASDGSVKCWEGAAGTPTAVSGVAGVNQVAGRCALLSGGSVKCWGPGGSGQIGNGTNDDQATPQLVQQLGTATRLAAGRNHVCALLDDRSVSCWGKDGFFSPIDYGNLLLPISGLGEVVGVYAGGDSSCAIEADHTVKCWGSNLGGQLGEDREGNEFSPVVVHGLPGSE